MAPESRSFLRAIWDFQHSLKYFCIKNSHLAGGGLSLSMYAVVGRRTATAPAFAMASTPSSETSSRWDTETGPVVGEVGESWALICGKKGTELHFRISLEFVRGCEFLFFSFCSRGEGDDNLQFPLSLFLSRLLGRKGPFLASFLFLFPSSSADAAKKSRAITFVRSSLFREFPLRVFTPQLRLLPLFYSALPPSSQLLFWGYGRLGEVRRRRRRSRFCYLCFGWIVSLFFEPPPISRNSLSDLSPPTLPGRDTKIRGRFRNGAIREREKQQSRTLNGIFSIYFWEGRECSSLQLFPVLAHLQQKHDHWGLS